MNNSEVKPISLLSRRKLLLHGAIATAGLSLVGEAGSQEATKRTIPESTSDSSITLRIYKGFSENRLDLWDAVIHPDVKFNSPAGRNIDGISALKRWNQSFLDSFRPRTDLLDHLSRGIVAW